MLPGYSLGFHRLKLELQASSGEILAVSEKTIEIKSQNYKGALCIDSPSNYATIEKSGNNTLLVQGWAVAEDEKASLRILVDGQLVSDTLLREERSDVDQLVSPNYGGKSATPKPGFYQNISIDNYSIGVHVIRVEELSRQEVIIAASEVTITINAKKYSGLVCIDYPCDQNEFIKQDISQIELRGWAVSNDERATLKILLDGQEIGGEIARVERGDIDSIISPNYGGKSVTPNAGFSKIISTDQFSNGIHRIRVMEMSRYNEVINYSDILICFTNKKYQGEMCIDLPTPNQTYTKGEKMTISGWAVAEDKEATIEIYFDNIFHSTLSRYNRPDVEYFVRKYGWQTLNPGFGKMIESDGLSVGNHKVTIYEKSRYGDIIGGIEVNIIIKDNQIVNALPNNISNNNSNNQTPNVTNIPSNNNLITSGSKGIDVSQFQGNIDWINVANSGIKYAMIRIGYRGYGTGKLVEDIKFQTNFLNASVNGLKVGVYIYSTAINVDEAEQDAEYVISLLRKYGYQSSVTMPIAMDLELVAGVNTRDKNLSKSTRTSVANAFCDKIKQYGYTPMIYACTSFLNDNLNASQIPYDIWVAQYNSRCTYSGNYTIWQYSSTGKVSGIAGNVDCNICYKNY